MRVLILLFLTAVMVKCQNRGVGKFSEVYAWKQLSFNIDGEILNRDRKSADGLNSRSRRQYDNVYFSNDGNRRNYDDIQFPTSNPSYYRPSYGRLNFSNNMVDTPLNRPNDDDSRSFFIQYNNVPMGAEKVGSRLFVTVPRRRYGIPSTLNYLDLNEDTQRSPSLRPYPSLREARSLTSVYRTRADECGRLWMVDTGLMEIPNNFQQIQPPAIVVFDLRNDKQILRYQLKESDIPANNTPAGLASITLDTSNGCSNTFAYIPDLTTFGIIVYSLRDNDSWRVTHNYMHFNPLATTLSIAGQRFQWNDGIFSITLGQGRCRTAYFHPLISTQEFSVSTCVLNNKTASNDSEYWTRYSIVGERGENTQSTMHDVHRQTGVVFFAEVGRDAVSCWNTNNELQPTRIAVLARDQARLSYPADLHVVDDDVWVVANSLPRFSYSNLDTDEYNFFIYKGNVQDLISDTICAGRMLSAPSNYYKSSRYYN